ncbi:MAG: hypothetical protein WCA30_17565, partial [Dermatophilaceae bacterium]
MPLPSPSRRTLRLSLPGAVAVAAFCASTLLGGTAAVAGPSSPSLELARTGTYATGVFDASAAEIPAFDA